MISTLRTAGVRMEMSLTGQLPAAIHKNMRVGYGDDHCGDATCPAQTRTEYAAVQGTVVGLRGRIRRVGDWESRDFDSLNLLLSQSSCYPLTPSGNAGG